MASDDLSLDDDFMETMLSDFLDESVGYLSNLNDKLLTVDQLIREAEPGSPAIDPEIMNEMFRDAHSLKGLSAMLRLGNINNLTHHIENLFDAAREDRLTLTSEVVELLFDAFDRLSGMVENLNSAGHDRVEFESVAEAIQRILDAANADREQLTGEEMQAALDNQRGSSAPATSIGDGSSDDAAHSAPEIPTGSAQVPEPSLVTDPFAGMTDELESSRKYLSIFVEETFESLDELYDSLSEPESPSQINKILTRCHQIKGSAASIGLQRPAKLAHLMEDLLQELREANRQIDPHVADALGFAADSLRGYAEQLQAGELPVEDNFAVAYRRLLSGLSDSSDDPSPADDTPAAGEAKDRCAATGANEGADEISSRLAALEKDVSEDELPHCEQPLVTSSQQDGTPSEAASSERPAEDATHDTLEHDQPDELSECTGSDALTTQDSSAAETDSPATTAQSDLPQLDDSRTSGKATEFRSSTLLSEEREKICMAARADRDSLIGVALLQPGIPLADIKVQLLWNRLEQVGDVFFRSPAGDELEEADLTRVLFGVASDLSVREVRDAVDLDGVTKITLESLSAQQPKTSNEQDATPNASQGLPGSGSSDASVAATSSADHGHADDTGLEPKPSLSGRLDSPTSPGAGSSGSSEKEQISNQAPAERPDRATSSNQSVKQKPAETLRVDIERLDQLMNLAGQLVINRARFGQIYDQLKSLSMNKQVVTRLSGISHQLTTFLSEAEEQAVGKQDQSTLLETVRNQIAHIDEDLELVRGDVQQLSEARSLINQLSDAVHQLERISDGIQQSVMDTRMVPIGPLFSRFKRVIRDITRTNGKQVELVIRGEKTELDKRMIDELADPLIHMVRNSADHGIESPQHRREAGKPELGKITLDAFHRGNRVMIKIQDDGCGLDPEKLKSKAISKGIVSEQDAERMNSHEALQLIWEPGFSTAESITEISGRGMGMDIVRSKIEQLNGAVELESQVGVGTTVTIKLPLTMAILPCLLSVIDGDTFAIPVESVVEIVRVRRKDFSTVGGALTARVRDRVIPVISLKTLFNWNDRFATDEPEPEEYTLVVVGSDTGELGLSVEHLIGEEDIVVKSLAENYRNVLGLSGASILGDGSVSLILDVSAMMEMSRRKPIAGRSN